MIQKQHVVSRVTILTTARRGAMYARTTHARFMIARTREGKSGKSMREITLRSYFGLEYRLSVALCASINYAADV